MFRTYIISYDIFKTDTDLFPYSFSPVFPQFVFSVGGWDVGRKKSHLLLYISSGKSWSTSVNILSPSEKTQSCLHQDAEKIHLLVLPLL